MAYPDKPTGNYTLRDYDFAQADSKKIPMDEYMFKNGYKNAEESDTESVPDAHSQNWLFDILHRNLRYAIGTAEENKDRINNFRGSTSSVIQNSELNLTSGGAYTNLVRRGSSTTATGSANQPIYVKADGQVATCNTMVATTGDQTVAGNKTFSGTMILSKTTDASGTANNSPALIVGGAVTAQHLEFDGNEIMSKTNATTVGMLTLNNEGGDVVINGGSTNKVIISGGNVTAPKFTGALTGNVTGNATTATTATTATKATNVNNSRDNGSLKLWTGTSAQYNAISSKDANTLYNITDDDSFTLSMLEVIYPVGSIYLTTNNSCPLSTLFGTWQKVSSGRVLQGADSTHTAGTTIEAGLPNITGNVNLSWVNYVSDAESGALYKTNSGESNTSAGNVGGGKAKINIDASRSNSIYGKSTTVQPPAYCVNIFRRTA